MQRKEARCSALKTSASPLTGLEGQGHGAGRSGLWGQLPACSRTALFSLRPHEAEEARELSGVSFIGTLIPGTLTLQLPVPSPCRSGFRISVLGGRNPSSASEDSAWVSWAWLPSPCLGGIVIPPSQQCDQIPRSPFRGCRYKRCVMVQRGPRHRVMDS